MIRSFHVTESGAVKTNLSADEVRAALGGKGKLWVDFTEPTAEESAWLSDVFHFHPLTIDDCLRPVLRPRVDVYDDYLFLIVHGPVVNPGGKGAVKTSEMDAYLGRNYLVTYEAGKLSSIQQTFEQCEKAPTQTMGRGVDLLLYLILDRMAENYRPIMARIEAGVDAVEAESLHGRPGKEFLPKMMRLRRELLNLRRVIMAQRDAVSLMSHQPGTLITDRARVYFRDVVDLYQRLTDTIELQRDVLSGARDIYLTALSNRTNEIVKTLTMIATIVMPMTLVSSVYGMNFKFMPELTWHYGYPFALGLMVAIGLLMAAFFRSRKWL